MGVNDFVLWHTSPVIDGYALLGDLGTVQKRKKKP
jgi:hypothetical protein